MCENQGKKRKLNEDDTESNNCKQKRNKHIAKERYQATLTYCNTRTYYTQHPEKSKAIIFTNFYIDGGNKQQSTEWDARNLATTVTEEWNFFVNIYKNKSYNEMQQILYLASQQDYSDCDCIMIIVLSHGNINAMRSADLTYKVDELYDFFIPEKCPSLAYKPKLYFIHYTEDYSSPSSLEKISQSETHIETERGLPIYLIPNYADILTVYSIAQEYENIYYRKNASIFIDALCDTIKNEDDTEIQDLLRSAAEKTTFIYSYYNMEPKVPIISSTLTRECYFTD